MFTMLLLLLGCPKSHPPALYPIALPELDKPAELDYPRADDTCPSLLPILTGEAMPHVRDGRATCGGLLVPDDEFAQLVWLRDVSEPWYRAYAGECFAGRARDRAWAQEAFEHQLEIARDAEREARVLRATGPALFVSGLVVGAGAVVLATSIQVEIVSP